MKNAIVLLILLFALARAQIISEDGYTLSQENINRVIALSEILAEQDISNKDIANIVNWTIADFKLAPKLASQAHQVLADWQSLLDNAKSEFEYDLLKYSLFKSLYFDWKIPSAGSYDSFLSIVQNYNSVFAANTDQKYLVLSKDVIAKNDGYYFTNLMQDALIAVGEWLARAQFSQVDKNALRRWSIDSFNKFPKLSISNSVYFFNDLLPQIYLQNKAAYLLEDLREERFNVFYLAFQTDPYSASQENDLMDIVVRYNPIIIEDKTNKLVLTSSAIDEAIKIYSFLEGIVSSPVTVSEQAYALEKASLISSFINRIDKAKFNSGSWFLMRSRSLWYSLSPHEQEILARQMKQAYDTSNSITQALNPLYSSLRLIIQQEQQIMTNALILNQQAFNNILNSQQQFDDMIAQEFTDFTTKQSLAIAGARILFETADYYGLEYEDGGVRYQVYKRLHF